MVVIPNEQRQYSGKGGEDMKKALKKTMSKKMTVVLYSKNECPKQYCGICLNQCQV